MEITFKDQNSEALFKKNKPSVKKHGNAEKQKNISDELKIPKKTQNIVEQNKVKIDNFNLRLNKFARHNIESGYKIEKQDINENFFHSNWDKEYKKFVEEHNNNISQIFEQENRLEVDFKTSYYLLIGSEESIYESSIRLHHIYGFPYIPASAIKGVFRNYIINEKYEGIEAKALSCKNFVEILGSQDKEGKVIFFDAFPSVKPTLKLDVLTPHYKEYYNGNTAPTDTQNPEPFKFLTLKDTTFKFIIGTNIQLNETKLNDIEIDLKECLKTYGIGAKTSAGYGYME